MVELETSSRASSGFDKTNKCHKHTLDKLYKQCWNSMMKVITKIYLIKTQSTLKYQSNDCNQLQLAFATDALQKKQLDVIHDAST